MSASPGLSSSESGDADEDGSHQLSPERWQRLGQAFQDAVDTSPQQPRTAPLQKRRRVTRACDECRRKKIKCDGKQPCTHCTVYSYDCTYDQPSNRKRNPTPQYIEALENRLQHAEELLRTFIPDVDLNVADLDALVQQRRGVAARESRIKSENNDQPEGGEQEISAQDAELHSMIETTGQIALDDSGHWDFRGGSSGTVFLERMREKFGGLLGNNDAKATFPPKEIRPIYPLFDSPSSIDSPLDINTLELPNKQVARQLCYNSLHYACSLLRFVHEPSFYEMFEKIYNTPHSDFSNDEIRFLPLLYVVLALGCRFAAASTSPDVEEADFKASIEQGLKYFNASRNSMDITDCRDITSLQAILFMILFLQTSSNLSTCYSYIGLALRSALRMGLHRNISSNFNLIEREVRRRAFWVIRKMDTYVSALLGFPRMLSDEDIDQELPIEVDDEYITRDGLLPIPAGTISQYVASNAHTRLMDILAKAVRYIYPFKGVESCLSASSRPTYNISLAKIREVEQDLEDWHDKLPPGFQPGSDASEEILRVQQLLRVACAHVKMMLYRPFLHYVSQASRTSKSFDAKAYACATACVGVSRNIVRIAAEMSQQGLLNGAYWFTVYTTFFGIISLAYFVHENPSHKDSQEILIEAQAGRDALRYLAKRNVAANRCSTTLVGLFEQLPKKLKQSCVNPILPTKKRTASSFNIEAVHEIHPPHLPNPANSNAVHYAATFPAPTSTPFDANRQALSFDTSRYPLNSEDTNLGYKFQGHVSPIDMSASGTPESAHKMQPSLGFRRPFGDGQPDIAAMMFSSADQFPYTNQPMIEYDSQQHELTRAMANGSAAPIFLSNGTSPVGRYDNIEGQYFGPLLPYMSAGQLDISQVDMCPSSGLNAQDLTPQQGLTPGAVMDFDVIFGGKLTDYNMSTERAHRQ